MIDTQIHISQISENIKRFIDIVGKRFWIKRIQLIEDELRGNSDLKEFLVQENVYAYKLQALTHELEKFGIIRRKIRLNKSFYPVYALAIQFLSLYDKFPEVGKRNILRRIQSSFNNLSELRAILIEFATATHFASKGITFSFPELEGTGTFDFLIPNLGENGLEIECKSVSSGIGRKLNAREAATILGKLRNVILQSNAELSGGLALIITLDSNIPRPKTDICEAVDHALFNKNDIQREGFDIKCMKFALQRLEGLDIKNNSSTRQLIDELSGTQNRESMIIGNSKRAVIVIVQSNKPDTTLLNIYKMIKDSAERQPTKSRPVFYIAGFEDITSEEIYSLLAQDRENHQMPTGLRITTSRFLNSEKRKHVAGIGYLSTCSYDQSSPGIARGFNSIYFFPNKESSFWHPSLEGLFKESLPADSEER